MATDTRTKGMLETRAIPRDLSALIPLGLTISSVQMTASRASPPSGSFPLQPTTLAAAVAVGASTIQLHANPGKGALLYVEAGTGKAEVFHVTQVTGSSDPWTATVRPSANVDHDINAPATYEPGVNARLFVNDTPTPVGSVVTPMTQKGAHTQKYHVSYLVTLNDGQQVEDEILLVVMDPDPGGTNIKQPTEIRDLGGEFTKRMNEPHQAGATLNVGTGTAYVSSSINTGLGQLTTQANAGASTISLNTHPGVGAMLVLTPAGTGNNPPERVYVLSVSGSASPYTVTLVSDLEFQHSNGADVTIYQGVSTPFLVSTSSTFLGLVAVNRARGGQAGKLLKVVWVATTSQGEVLQVAGLVDVQEVL